MSDFASPEERLIRALLRDGVGFTAPRPFPERAAEGWPMLGWEEARDSFLNGLTEAEALTENVGQLEQPFIPSTTSGNPYTVGPHSVGWALLDLVAHNAHHLGQIVTVRQLLGAWPPAGAG